MTQHNRETLLALADRCEKATGVETNRNTWPEYPLEADIFEAVGGPRWERMLREGAMPCGAPEAMCREFARQRAPHFTASLDAAMSLVDPRALWAVGSMEEGPFARLCWPMPDGGFTGGYVEAHAATPAIALVAAALRARATLDPTGEKA